MSEIRKLAMVTGGLSGIGRAIAKRLAAEGMGVVIVDVAEASRDDALTGAQLASELGHHARFLRADVCNSDEIDAVFHSIESDSGGIDVLVNNAGIASFTPLSMLTDQEFMRVLTVNVNGAFQCARRAIALMRASSRPGVIVNMASNFGLVGATNAVAYCASKGAVISMTQALAIEVGAEGIRVNALCPGATATEFNRSYRQEPGVNEEWAKMTPLRLDGGRYLATAEEIAEAAAFLATDASRFMTGSAMVVDGGWNAG